MTETGIWDAYGAWDEIAQRSDIIDVKNMITGCRIWRPNFVSEGLRYVLDYAVEEMLVSSSRSVPTVIDFGCGLGRNGPMLRQVFPRVVGLDLPEMVSRLKSELPIMMERTYGQLYPSAAALAESEDFCALYDSVAFQHIADSGYISDLIDTLSANPRFRTFISVFFGDGIHTPHLEVLRQKGWQMWHTEPDMLSFEGTLHTIAVFRRW